MLYQAYQAHTDMLLLSRAFAKAAAPMLNGASVWPWELPSVRKLAAAYEVYALAALTHSRPDFDIDYVEVEGETVPVHEEVVHRTPFGSLLHFRKETDRAQPPVLMIAPMSGHFATLLRETIRTMLQDHDVYVTDWHNARDVPLWEGNFGLDEYVDHVVDFMDIIGPDAHMFAICQPCVPALAAVALMAEDDHPATPRSLTLMAGPIDCRVNPTEVNELATSKSIEWFERNLVATVPMRYMGAWRRVYPGFIQLSAFLNMNLDRHLSSFRVLFNDLADGDVAQSQSKREFYEEYFAVADLPAEFYLETVRVVFQEYALAKGEFEWRGRRVDLSAIRDTALLTIEGERDDICSLGQTEAAHGLCSGIPTSMKQHYVQEGAGHYGVFNGRRWNNGIYPRIRDLIAARSPNAATKLDTEKAGNRQTESA
ncbi:polyhydroxyalkanoate depolymerase [Ectothiorhodospiraceae bacterium WFHF3C12]|nr:polyhydroxyalkanoate depolymerase [Ectothiorhodospiraceae bacterium WFHF3C12]